MNSLLLSRLSRDFLNTDPEVVGRKARYRMGWAGSVLVGHQEMSEEAKSLLATREQLAGLFSGDGTGPKLAPPEKKEKGGFKPYRYFSQGTFDMDRRKNPDPIWYLLTETSEKAQARPVPGSSLLLRSICKGKGILKQNKQGLVFLDVDNRFISSLLPYLKAYGLVRPPYFNIFASPDGAHVPVIPGREVDFHYLTEIAELDREFSFEIEGLYSMEPTAWPEVEQVWFFKVHSPELEKLRRKYFLPSLPGGHSFHIAIAIKPRLLANPTSQPVMRINTAFLVA